MKPVWRDGNRVELLENGEEFFPRVIEAINAARDAIHIETFILAEDCVGEELSDALCAARERGVDIDLLADGFGSDPLSEKFVARLRDAGVRLLLFAPQPRLFGFRTSLFRRLHRKIVVIDRQIAFIGGINFCRDHLVESGPRALQDYAVSIEGPLVHDLAEAGAELLGDLRRPRRWWQRRRRRSVEQPDQPHCGPVRGKMVVRDNRRHRTAIEREYRLAIRTAKEEVVIANAYFFPGFRLLRDLRKAAKRGVRVIVIVQGNPDLPIVTVIARWLYRYLVPAGVEIHEYCERPMHVKVAVMDRRWSTIGSSNLDPLSLSLNLEANVMLDDAGFAKILREQLQKLIDNACNRVEEDQVPRRSVWQMLLGVVVFHFLRRFPRWARSLPAHRPRIVAPGAESVEPDSGDGKSDRAISAAPDGSNATASERDRRTASSDSASGDAHGSASGGRFRGLVRAFWIVFAVVVVGLIGRLAWETEWSEVGAAIARREWSLLLAVAAAAGLSHLAFGAYDVISRRVVAPRLAVWRTWVTATACYALNLNLGALIGGVGLRYKLYRRQKLAPEAATRIITLGVVANWVGYAIVVTALLPWAATLGWTRWISEPQAWLACAVGVGLLLTYFVLCARQHGFSVRGHRFDLLPLPLAAPQALLSAANWAWLGFVMSLCLGPEVSYPEALGILLASAVAGAVAHVPGGWGVIEVVVVTLLAGRLPQSELIASVLLYRAANYLLPLPAAVVAYLGLARGGDAAASQPGQATGKQGPGEEAQDDFAGHRSIA